MRAASAALALALATACGAERAAPTHVLLVVLDATHAAELTCYGGPDGLTPNLDRIAATGARFERAFSNNSWTLPSTVSLLTGQLQETHGVVTNGARAGDELLLLPEVFAQAGWRTAGFVQMVYASRTYGLDQGFEHYEYRGHDEAGEPGALVHSARRWLAEHADENTFTYLHLRRPHSPYDPRPQDAVDWVGPWPFETWEAPKRASHADVAGERPLSDEHRAGALYLYRANLATVDRQLAPLLEEWGAREDTLVIVTADHGEGFGQHGFFGHGARLWAEVVDIPLIVAGYGIEATVDGAPVSTIDVAPTLLDLCRLDIEGGAAGRAFDGTSFAQRLAGPAGEERTIALSGRYIEGSPTMPEVGAVRGSLKVVVAADGSVRAHDRVDDPEERNPLPAPDPELVRFAEALRARGLARAAEVDAGEEAPLSDEILEELRALGYGD